MNENSLNKDCALCLDPKVASNHLVHREQLPDCACADCALCFEYKALWKTRNGVDTTAVDHAVSFHEWCAVNFGDDFQRRQRAQRA